jgi:UDP-galactose transporter B1
MSTPVLSFAPPAFFYIAAMYTSNVALQYIDYPTQVLGKSCKPLSGKSAAGARSISV